MIRWSDLPAYLAASLVSDDPLDKYGADIRHYMLATLQHWSHQTGERATETRERLSRFGPYLASRSSSLTLISPFKTRRRVAAS